MNSPGWWVPNMLVKISRDITPKRMETEPKQKQCPVEDLPGGQSKERYCIGTWNVRSMNQDKLEVVKQEMAKMNINILGLIELKWTGIGKFSSDNHYIYYSG